MAIRPEIVFIGIVLLVPAQWFLSPSETSHLKYHLNGLLTTVKEYLPSFLSAPSPSEEEAAENKAMQAEMDPKGNGAYGMGKYSRQRSPEVEFRVGDVISHKKLEFRGVIIGWDEHAVAPQEYLRVAHAGNKHFSTQPNYAVLIDTRDRLTPQLTYLVQENIQLEQGKVMHPLIDQFFDGFDVERQKYNMRPIYKQWYPDD